MSTPPHQTFGSLMLALALLVPGQAFAGEAEWQAHMDEGASAYRAADSVKYAPSHKAG
jgi:hypothetical protein